MKGNIIFHTIGKGVSYTITARRAIHYKIPPGRAIYYMIHVLAT
jgi:hypothetical protein